MDSNTAWDNYKSALLNGEINADTYALLTAELPTRKVNK